ncbi:MAG: hypothetical protein AAF682_13300, partial [Planctomycetota bacterium]
MLIAAAATLAALPHAAVGARDDRAVGGPTVAAPRARVGAPVALAAGADRARVEAREAPEPRRPAARAPLSAPRTAPPAAQAYAPRRAAVAGGGGTVCGFVAGVAPRGASLADLAVFAERACGGPAHVAFVAADGRFELAGLDADAEVLLRVSARSDATVPALALARRLRLDLAQPRAARGGEHGVVLALDAGGVLALDVRDAATQEPLRELRVSVTAGRRALLLGAGGATVTSWPGGAIRLAGFAVGDEARIELATDSHSATRVDVRAVEPGAAPLRVALLPLREQRVEVRDAVTHAPLVGAAVAV